MSFEMEVLIKIKPQEFIKDHFSTSVFSLEMSLKSSKSCFYNRGPNSQTLVGFGNFPKFKNLSQIFFQNPRNWENSQSLVTLSFSSSDGDHLRLSFLRCNSGWTVVKTSPILSALPAQSYSLGHNISFPV